MNIYECGFIEEDGAVLVSDWIELAKKFYGR
jgi:transcription termination factor NusB